MSLQWIDHDIDKIWLDCIEEGLWPTLVSSAIDRFPTARFESDSRLKGTVDFRSYTSQSEYPLIGWEVTSAEVPEWPAAAQLWEVSATGTVKIAHTGVSKHNDGTHTAARRMVVRDIHRAQTAIKAIDDTRYTHGAFGIDHASLITGKQSGRTYCVVNAEVSEPQVYKAPAQDGDIDALGADVWVGTFSVTIRYYIS